MNKYHVELTFTRDDEIVKNIMVIETQDHITQLEVESAIRQQHECFYNEDPEYTYYVEGCTPETLVRHVCKNHGWKWHPFAVDSKLEFMISK